MTTTLRPETEIRLRERAERDGQDANALANALLADALASDPDDLTEEEIAEVRAGIRRGLEAERLGVSKPLAKAVVEARQRHGFPPTWANVADGTA